jgi:thioredoxin-like negative regulator of GroEL
MKQLQAAPPGVAVVLQFAVVVLLLLSGAAAASAQVADDRSAAELVSAARAAAQADRNQEAAELFAAALARDPALRGTILREYADQLTWSGRARQAIPLYEEVIARQPGSAEAQQARVGLALAYSWTDRHGQAIREYRAVLATDPANQDARLGIIRSTGWRDRFREQQRLAEHFLGEHPGNPAAQLLLARGAWGAGRPDRAEATVLALLREEPGHEEAEALLADIRLAQRPRVRVDGTGSRQVDGLAIASLATSFTRPLAGGRSAAGVSLHTVSYRPDATAQHAVAGGLEGVNVVRPTLHGRHRLGDWTELNAHVATDIVRFNGGAEESWTTPTLSAWLTMWPGDLWRLDLSANRRTLDNVRSLAARVAEATAGASADFNPSELTRLTGRASASSYTDGNARWKAEAEFMQRVLQQPRLQLGARGNVFRFREVLSNGYFNPDRYRSLSALTHAWGRLGEATYWDLDGSYGWEWVEPGESKPLWSGAGRLVWVASERVEVEVRLNHFSSLLASSSGFERTTVGLGVQVLW